MRGIAKGVVAAALTLGVVAALPAAASAQGPPQPLPEPKVHPIQVTGPPAQRLNLIILGDGYQWDQQSIFLADVDRNLSVMWATEPFRTYRNYINVYAVEIASIDYGVRCDPDGRDPARRRHDPRHRRPRGADRRQEHRAADDLPSGCTEPAGPRHGLRRRAAELRGRRARTTPRA